MDGTINGKSTDALSEKVAQDTHCLLYTSMQIIIHPVNDDDYTENNIEVKIDKIKINKNDSYESCKKRMESKNNLSEYTANYVEELDKLSRLSWLFVSPEKEEKFKFPKGDFKKFILQF